LSFEASFLLQYPFSLICEQFNDAVLFLLILISIAEDLESSLHDDVGVRCGFFFLFLSLQALHDFLHFVFTGFFLPFNINFFLHNFFFWIFAHVNCFFILLVRRTVYFLALFPLFLHSFGLVGAFVGGFFFVGFFFFFFFDGFDGPDGFALQFSHDLLQIFLALVNFSLSLATLLQCPCFLIWEHVKRILLFGFWGNVCTINPPFADFLSLQFFGNVGFRVGD